MGLLHKKQQNTKIIPLVSYPLEVRHQMCVNKSHTSTNCIKNHIISNQSSLQLSHIFVKSFLNRTVP